MQVNGREFMRNVSIEQEKSELAQQQEKLDKEKREAFNDNSEFFDAQDEQTESVFKNTPPPPPLPKNDTLDGENLYDIKLDTDSNTSNKKRYILLGVALITLFIITIVIIRLISNSEQEKQFQEDSKVVKTTSQDKILDRIDSEQYTNVRDEKIEHIKKILPKKEDMELPVAKVENIPQKVVKTTPKVEPKKDLFGMNKNDNVKYETAPKVGLPPKKAEQSIIERTTLLPLPSETNFAKKSDNSLKGYYVQIGAFKRRPSDKLLNKIEKKGYQYTIYKIDIKGVRYNKLLIGAYKTKSSAKIMINSIRKDFHNPNAYILRF